MIGFDSAPWTYWSSNNWRRITLSYGTNMTRSQVNARAAWKKGNCRNGERCRALHTYSRD
eukprot:2907446-Pyramimonas_sp.AAC.1